MFNEEMMKKKLDIVAKSHQLLEDLTWKNKHLSNAERLLTQKDVSFTVKFSVDYVNLAFDAGNSRELLKEAVRIMTAERDALLEEINKLILIAQ